MRTKRFKMVVEGSILSTNNVKYSVITLVEYHAAYRLPSCFADSLTQSAIFSGTTALDAENSIGYAVSLHQEANLVKAI